MKKQNKKELLIYALIITITCVLKFPYIAEIIDESTFIPYDILIFYSKNNYINFVWLIPIIANVFIVSSSLYYTLMNFDTRFRNRNKYLLKILKESIIKNVLFALIAIIIQWIIFILIFKFKISLSVVLLTICLKYAIEIYLFSIIIMSIALVINNFIYSFVINISLMILLINSFRLPFVPFVNLYCNYKINIFDTIILLTLIIVIKLIYSKKDLGGIKNEIDS